MDSSSVVWQNRIIGYETRIQWIMSDKDEKRHQHVINTVSDLPTPKHFCEYFKQPVCVFIDFWQLFFFSLLMYHQSIRTKQCCKLTFSIIQMHYKSGTLLTCGCLIFFCKHLQKSFSIKDCRTFSPKERHSVCCFYWCLHIFSWTVFVWWEHVSLVSCILPPLCWFMQPFVTISFNFKPTIFENG